ncbi:ShlB/FhaC/HecB family hemolysin secretion/activation protein [Gloeothece verrucosa]|uniref:Polypeptide-transport-associated domain protein ShlB-type n=1 Tax=Gloeothece verrucosa (strain PCC 7822) TaxID=497965 RepID=E0UAQ6_GLOV7|nr:ShlB/FhaC/HecB family hemolysin secretion/activation protein [Gloeothece verrucosa]ADN13908.1 Polypeptide-transport-associated domain protein ShlB-type [Gloeothece verrucosa PCC 7822]
MEKSQGSKQKHWQKLFVASALMVEGVMIIDGNKGLATPISEQEMIFSLENQELDGREINLNTTKGLELKLGILENSEQNFPQIVAEKSSSTLIQINKVEVVGSTVFGAAELDPIIKPLEGTEATEQQLREAASAITQLYLNAGYLNSRAIVQVADGVAIFQVLEGTIGNIVIEGTSRLQNYVRSRVELGVGKPLNVRKLENQLRLLRNDPLFKNVEATLKPPSTEQTSENEKARSTLVVRVTEANSFGGNVGADNYSPPSIGATRFNLNLFYRNVTGIGDQISTSYRPRFETWEGTYRLDLNYRAPLNPMEGAIYFTTLIERNRVINSIDDAIKNIGDLGIEGRSERYTLEYRQPLIRTPRQEFALSTGFSYYNGRTFLFNDVPTQFGFGPNNQGVTITSVFTFGQDYVSRQRSGAWGLRSQFRFGTGILDATENPEPIPDGQFFSWLGQVQRLQLINPNNFLIIQLDLQLTPDPLLPSEQFVIGGAESVRGYRQNVMAGDNGARFSIEDRITLVRNRADNPVFILAPFFDVGAIWNAEGNPNTILANQTVIAGLGLGLIWQPIDKLNIRLDYAPPLMDLNIRGDDVQDDGFYFSVNYGF